jgi:hypothetical protein
MAKKYDSSPTESLTHPWRMLVHEPWAGSEEDGSNRRVFLGPIIIRPITAYVGFYDCGHALSLYCLEINDLEERTPITIDKGL